MATRLAALDYVTVSIRNFHDAGNTTGVRTALAHLAALFDRLGCYEPAATSVRVTLDKIGGRWLISAFEPG
jgi:hypothetical protein